MWIFLNNSFISIVEYQPVEEDVRNHLLVRARAEGDLESFLLGASTEKAKDWITDCSVFTDNAADYHYRLIAPKWLVAECLATHVTNIDYPNFKNSVSNARRRDNYMDVWRTMYSAYGGY
jgi:hypothetical protein